MFAPGERLSVHLYSGDCPDGRGRHNSSFAAADAVLLLLFFFLVFELLALFIVPPGAAFDWASSSVLAGV